MLKQRVATAVVAVIVVVGVIFWGPTAWNVLITAGCVIGAYEFAAMNGQKWFQCSAMLAYAVVLAMIWCPNALHPWALQAALAVALLIPVLTRNRVSITQSAVTLVGALYIGMGGASLGALRAEAHGVVWLFLLLISIWATDTVAYFAGSFFKGPKLWPEISPKKTVSGAVFGVLGGGVAAGLVGWLFLPDTSILADAGLGCVISVLGQLGDLVESAYKRSAGVKDSGKIFPGHGGILDRVDSLLFAAPFAAYLIMHKWIQF